MFIQMRQKNLLNNVLSVIHLSIVDSRSQLPDYESAS